MEDVVSKNILNVINKNSSPVVKKEVITETKPRKGVVVKKKVTTYTRKKAPKKTVIKVKKSFSHAIPIKHMKDVKKHMTSLSKQVRKREATLQKQFTEHAENLQQVRQDVLETKAHYQHIPKLTLETQMMIESMNKLTAVVKQMLVLFNKKMDAEDGPLFSKLNEISDQNEKIAEGILVVADLVKSEQTPPAQIKNFNPYIPKQSTEQVRPQMSMPSEQLQMPPDLGSFSQEQQEPQPIMQYNAPLPVNAPPEQRPISRKRMLF